MQGALWDVINIQQSIRTVFLHIRSSVNLSLFLAFWCQKSACQSYSVSFRHQINQASRKSSATTQGRALFPCPCVSETPQLLWQQEILRERHLLSFAQFVVEMQLRASLILAWRKRAAREQPKADYYNQQRHRNSGFRSHVQTLVCGRQTYTERLKGTKDTQFIGYITANAI